MRFQNPLEEVLFFPIDDDDSKFKHTNGHFSYIWQSDYHNWLKYMNQLSAKCRKKHDDKHPVH